MDRKTQKWQFRYLDDMDKIAFILEIEVNKNPYNEAYYRYGPQVDDMIYAKYFENEK